MRRIVYEQPGMLVPTEQLNIREDVFIDLGYVRDAGETVPIEIAKRYYKIACPHSSEIRFTQLKRGRHYYYVLSRVLWTEEEGGMCGLCLAEAMTGR